MPGRILVDVLSVTGRRGGTETYAREVSRRLPEHLPGYDLVAFANQAGAGLVREWFPGDVEVLPVGADRVTWAAGEAVLVNARAARIGVDVIWCPANFGPLTRRVSRVTTVHDVTYHLAEGGPIARAVASATARLMERTAKTSTAIITGSAAAKASIVERMGIPPDGITVIPHGTTDPTPVSDPRDVLARLGVPPGRPLVLSTGNRLPHKNFEGLLAALATIAPERRPVVVVTGGGPSDPLAEVVTQRGLHRDVILPGWVSSAQLEALYACADVYVCPSLAEGFGLPVIDALRRGCPVIAHDIPVLREVGGTHAVYTDARSPTPLAEAIMARVSRGHDAQERHAAIAWSETFTWEASARATAAVLRSAAS